uniref:Acidic repeat-containing protein n=1 Tax=Melanaphis sacchari TaxID=742174 RepID=A0A2H8TPB7_9HEMI
MEKSAKIRLNTKPKLNKKKEDKLVNENSSGIKTSIKNMSDKENDNFSDSSLELFDTFQPRSKTKINSNQKIDHNIYIDHIDISKESNIELKKCINYDLSVYNISSSSNDSFKSFTSLHSNPVEDNLSGTEDSVTTFKCKNRNDIHDNLYKFKNNYITPVKNHIQSNHLSESAKLLDRIYGKEWRCIDGVLKNSKTKYLNNEIDDDLNQSLSKNISSKNFNEINYSSPFGVLKKHQEYNIQNKVDDASIILENFSLSNDINEVPDQLNIINPSTSRINDKILKPCEDKKQLNNFKIIKGKTFKENSNTKKNDAYQNLQSKIPIKSNIEATLSFLSSLSCFTGSMKCDPEAMKYKLKFKKNKDDLVSVLFKLFNKEVFDDKLPADMNFKWNARLRSTAGACFNKRSVKINKNLDCERVSRIELSSKIIDTAERLRDTLIHELCHAACWIFNGISEGHGPQWKSWANKAMQKFPELPIIKRCHSYDIQTKFTYKCVKCGYSFGRHSKSLNLEKKRCGHCYGEFELIKNKINNNPLPNNNFPVVHEDPLKELYSLNDVQQKPKLPKKLSKFAIFVKENYSRVKRENPLSKHGEIMKLLGSQFATTKVLTPDEVFDKLFDS